MASPTLSELITGPTPERAPLQDVVRRIQELRTAGRTAQEAAGEVQAMGWTPAEVKSRISRLPPPGSIDSVAQGSSLGFADELNAALLSPVRAWKEGIGLPDARNQILEDKRTGLELYKQQAPVMSTVSELAGGAMLPIPGRAPRSLGGAVAQGAATGAGAGALYGAGTGEDTDSRLDRAVGGAVVGGALGGAIPLAAGVMRGAKVQSPGGAAGTSRAMIADALADEGMTGNQAADRIAAANAAGKRGVTPMDVAQGGRVLGLAEDVVNSPNAAQAGLKTQLAERQMGARVNPGQPLRGGQYDRLLNDLDELSGVRGGRAAFAMQALESNRRAAANPAFQRAWLFNTANSQPIRQAFTDLAGTDAGPKAYQRAVMIARNEMPNYRPPSWESLFDQQGNLQIVPDARFMHFMKMGLDDLYSSAARGETGMGATVANSIRSVRNNFRDTLKAENPAYGAALDQFAGSMALQQAVEDGAAAMLKSPEELAVAMQGLTPSETEAFRVGALTKVVNTLGQKRPGPTADVAGALNSPNFVRKITMLMPDPAARAEWTQRLDLENAFSNTAKIAGNSRTAARQELAEQSNGEELSGRLLADAGQGLPTSMWHAITSGLAKVSKPVADFAKRQRRGATGAMLSQTDQQAEAFLRGLDNRPPVIGYQAPRLAIPGAVGAVGALAPSPSPQPPLLRGR